jgi:Tol biopolymer transport system component
MHRFMSCLTLTPLIVGCQLQTGGSSFFVRAPRWSPDGSRIVFSMFLRKTGRFDIYTANDDGNDLARLTDTPEFEDFAHWGAGSAATKQLVLSGDRSE